MGLTGFDSSFVVCTCNPNCSDSLNGAKNRIANEQFREQQCRTGPVHRSPATEAEDDGEKDR